MKALALLLVFCGSAIVQAAAPTDAVLIKNFREIYSSYESIMQIDGKDRELQELYALNKSRLPKYGLPSEMNNAVVLATTELSGGFCKKAIDKEKTLEIGQRVLYKRIDFARGPIQFQSFIKEKLINELAMLFWLREAKPEEMSSLSASIDRLGEEAPNDLAQTENVLQVLCTGFGTSLAFLVK